MKFGCFILSSRANCCSDLTRQQATHSLIQIVLWYSGRFAGGFWRPLSTPALIDAAGTARATHAAITRSESRDIRSSQYAAVAKRAPDQNALRIYTVSEKPPSTTSTWPRTM